MGNLHKPPANKYSKKKGGAEDPLNPTDKAAPAAQAQAPAVQAPAVQAPAVQAPAVQAPAADKISECKPPPNAKEFTDNNGTKWILAPEADNKNLAQKLTSGITSGLAAAEAKINTSQENVKNGFMNKLNEAKENLSATKDNALKQLLGDNTNVGETKVGGGRHTRRHKHKHSGHKHSRKHKHKHSRKHKRSGSRHKHSRKHKHSKKHKHSRKHKRSGY